jgi:hypothetical protein
LSSTFGSSTLVRLLAQWTHAGDEAPADLGEHLSRWVSAFDAIQLQAALRGIKAMQAQPAGHGEVSRLGSGLAEAFERARMTLVGAIGQAPALPNEFTYTPYKRRHLELQRQMEQMVSALRDHVRQALARATPQLQQLAALDAALEKVIAPREQALLPTAAAVLERRFAQLRKQHQKDSEAAEAQDDPAGWRQAGGWLHAFEKDWRDALLAELELRLEPVAGLIEATGTELNHQQ